MGHNCISTTSSDQLCSHTHTTQHNTRTYAHTQHNTHTRAHTHSDTYTTQHTRARVMPQIPRDINSPVTTTGQSHTSHSKLWTPPLTRQEQPYNPLTTLHIQHTSCCVQVHDIQADTHTHTHTYSSGTWVLFLLPDPPLLQIQLMLVVGRHRTRKHEATSKVHNKLGNSLSSFTRGSKFSLIVIRHVTQHRLALSRLLAPPRDR